MSGSAVRMHAQQYYLPFNLLEVHLYAKQGDRCENNKNDIFVNHPESVRSGTHPDPDGG
jgi:hypothetical protein